MILPRFLLEGINGQQKVYRRDNFPTDPIIGYSRTEDAFVGKITNCLQDDHNKTIHIDNAYTITTLSDKIRKQNIEVWSRLKNKTKIIFIATVIGGLTGMSSAIALGVLLPNMLTVAMTIGVISVGIFSFSFFLSHRSKQAADQLKLWADPMKGYIEECRNHDIKIKLAAKARQALEASQQLLISQPKRNIEDLKSKVHDLIEKIRSLKIQEAETTNEPSSFDHYIQDYSKRILICEKKILDCQQRIENEQDAEKVKHLESNLQKMKRIKDGYLERREENIKIKADQEKAHISRKKEQNEHYHSFHINSISELVKISLTQNAVSREDAYKVLEDYFDEYPELKNIAEEIMLN